MSDLTLCLGQTAPLYNLLFVVVVIFLYVKLFMTRKENKDVYLTPWYCLFAAVCVFIAEEIITILRAAGILDIPMHINGFFELVIIILFIYALLAQKEHIKELKIKTKVTKKVKRKIKKKRKKSKKANMKSL